MALDTTYMTQAEIHNHNAMFEPYHRCDFCSVNVPESSMERIEEGYTICQDCYSDYANEPSESFTSWDRKHLGTNTPDIEND